MASNTSVTNNAVHFGVLNDEVLPKSGDNKLVTTETSKTDDVGEDDVFAHENDAARASSNKDHATRTTQAAITTIASLNKQSNFDHVIVSSQDIAANSGSSNITVPASTTRRPSYTSKAPSALTNLPKTLDDINSSPNNLSTFGLHGIAVPPKGSSVSDFENVETLRQKKLISQASFESLDDYSNPGTPLANTHGSLSSIANVHISGHKHRDKSTRMRADVLTRGKWEMAAKADVFTVRCRENVAELYKHKFGSGSKGKCIKFGEKWCTPIEFEAMSGRASCKDWKRSIRFHGQHLQKLIEDQYLTLHAISCTCGICCGDDTLTGPVKLFQSVKRKRSHMSSNAANSPGPFKRKSFSEEYRLAYRDRGISLSVDSDVFTLGQEDNSMPPMTPLTPLTPHTPFGANCLTPLPPGFARPNSPKSMMLQVPTPQATLNGMNIPVKELVQQHILPAPAHTKLQNSDINLLNQQPWLQLEEMASNLVVVANKLKLMIEQAKIQSEAIKDSAVTQAKIQAENEKAEALTLMRRTQQIQQAASMQLIPVSTNNEQLPQTHFAIQVSKACQNCGRDALLECTGCYRSYYCGPFCQQKDWAVHKNKCRGDVSEDAQQQLTTNNQITLTSEK